MEQKQVVNEVLSLALSELDKCDNEPVVEQAKQVINNLIDRLSGKVKEQVLTAKERKLPPILGADKKKVSSQSTNTTSQKSQEEAAVENSDLTASQILFDANVKKYKERYGSLTSKQLKAALKKDDIAVEVLAENLQIDISKYTGEGRYEVVLQRLLNL